MYKELEKFATGKKIKGVGILPDKTEIIHRWFSGDGIRPVPFQSSC